MGWTIQYRAKAYEGDIREFIEIANSNKLRLSWGSEKYYWELGDDNSAKGFTKIQSSLRPKADFIKIITELKRLAALFSSIRIDALDDYVLGDWWHVVNIKVEELNL